MTLGKKQTLNNQEWINVVNNIESLVPKEKLDFLILKTANDILRMTEGKKVAVSYSAGKDSIVLYDICRKIGIEDAVLVRCNLEYPAFIKWLEEHKPEKCTIVNTGQDLKWLSKHSFMLFPPTGRLGSNWFHAVQHAGQDRYFKENNLDMLLLGRRRADGNYLGKGTNIYKNNGTGVVRYSPLAYWTHEEILAYIHYYKLPLPPFYSWKDGYVRGTHPWARRKLEGSIENSWRVIYNIDNSIVIEASKYFESAREFLIKEGKQCK